MAGKPLEGLRVLIVEDEAMIAMLIEDLLGELGASPVKIASSIEEASESISSLVFDTAILDVNLRGKVTFPLADMLLERQLPFAFATGYGAATLPEKYRAVPVLQKPFQQEQLERALVAARSAG